MNAVLDQIKIKLQWKKVEQLTLSRELLPMSHSVYSGQIPAFKNIDFLTNKAARFYIFHAPPIVLIKNQLLIVIGNFRSSEIAKMTLSDEKIPVFCIGNGLNKTDWDSFALSNLFARSIIDALDLRYDSQSIVDNWQKLTESELSEISPEFISRSKLEKWTGINRRIKPANREYAKQPKMSCKARRE